MKKQPDGQTDRKANGEKQTDDKMRQTDILPDRETEREADR